MSSCFYYLLFITGYAVINKTFMLKSPCGVNPAFNAFRVSMWCF